LSRFILPVSQDLDNTFNLAFVEVKERVAIGLDWKEERSEWKKVHGS
jgi:hypothetical protein